MKVKAEELETLQEFVNKGSKTKDYILQCELEILKINKAKQEAYEALEAIGQDTQAFLEKINKEYGHININLEDGSYTVVKD